MPAATDSGCHAACDGLVSVCGIAIPTANHKRHIVQGGIPRGSTDIVRYRELSRPSSLATEPSEIGSFVRVADDTPKGKCAGVSAPKRRRLDRVVSHHHAADRSATTDQGAQGGAARSGCRAASKQTERVKRLLWHGNVDEALDHIDVYLWTLDLISKQFARADKLAVGIPDLRTYIRNNRGINPIRRTVSGRGSRSAWCLWTL
jgi:hypothetical protein